MLSIKKTAVIVVDMQERYFQPGRPLENSRGALVENVVSLISAAQERSYPVFFIKEVYKDDFSDAPKMHRDLRLPEVVEGNLLSDIVLELNTFLNVTNVLVKKRHSAFQDTDLYNTLSGLGVNHVVICGVNTDTCVLSTVLGARMDFAVTIVSDCVSSSRPEMHKIALELMTCKGSVVSLEEFLAA